MKDAKLKIRNRIDVYFDYLLIRKAIDDKLEIIKNELEKDLSAGKISSFHASAYWSVANLQHDEELLQAEKIFRASHNNVYEK